MKPCEAAPKVQKPAVMMEPHRSAARPKAPAQTRLKRGSFDEPSAGGASSLKNLGAL
jgi:hypothetical protein